MSAVLAIAEPRRIKASHRRRRKVTSGRFVQRYYDPQIGRFLSTDPVATSASDGSNFNRYWYANDNPFRFSDPDGRQSMPARTPNQAAAQVMEGAKLVKDKVVSNVKDAVVEAGPRVVQGLAGAAESFLGVVALAESLVQATVDDDASNVAKGMAGVVAIGDGYQSMRNALDGGDRRTIAGTVAEAVGGPAAGDAADLVSSGANGFRAARSIDALVTTGSKRAAAEAASGTVSTVQSASDMAKKEP